MRIRLSRFTIAVFVVLVLATSPKTQASTCSDLKGKMSRSHIPDVAIAVLDRGRLQMYYCSLADTALSADSVFEAASLSKPVFAAAVLTLVRQGQLDLDRPLAAYLHGPYFHQQNPFGQGTSDAVTDSRFQRITARMILSHTSGLPNWSRHQPLTLLRDPGISWSYSGEGYVYLQKVIETITGKPLQTFVQSAVFTPLQMEHSSFVWEPKLAVQEMRPHAADGKAEAPAHYGLALASSTLYTTLDDYERFVSALLHPTTGSPFALEESEQVMVNPKLDLAWGLGVAIQTAPQKAYFHWGANPGFQSFFMVQPASARGVLFLTDSDNGLDLLDAVVSRFLPGKHPILRFPMLHPKD
jgi:CubicO group peptidase (beta-lactamase class C family)